ncbi:MAG: hypothetical protein PHN72_00085 [Bacilli bacterium]|nr:hypothetical protein [Bacilli bacterium]
MEKVVEKDLEPSDISLITMVQNLKEIEKLEVDIESNNDKILQIARNIEIFSLYIKIEVAELASIRTELNHVAKQMKELSEIAMEDAKHTKAEVDHNRKTINTTILNCNKNENDFHLLQELKQNIKEIIQIETIIRKTDENISRIAEQVKLQAINISVSAYRIGEKGKPLTAITGQMESLIMEIAQLIEKSNKDVEKIDVLLQPLLLSFDEEYETESKQVDNTVGHQIQKKIK